MRRFTFLYLIMILVLPGFADAKTNISVPRFVDKATQSPCPDLTNKAKADLDQYLQNRLISGLMELERFQVREREIRRLKPEHKILGTVRAFEVCAGEGRGQKARIEIEVQMVSAKDGLTHMFSSSASSSSATADHAPQMAVNTAINELIRRIDDAVPRREAVIRLKGKREVASESPLQVRLLPRERRSNSSK